MIAFFFLIKSTINFSRLVFLNLYKKFAKIRRAEFPLKIANTIQVDSQSYSTHVSHIWNQRRDSITKKRNTGGESASVRFSIELKNFHDSVRFRFAVARPWNVVSLLRDYFLQFLLFLPSLSRTHFMVRHDRRFFEFFAWKIDSPCCCVLVLISIEQIRSYILTADRGRPLSSFPTILHWLVHGNYRCLLVQLEATSLNKRLWSN